MAQQQSRREWEIDAQDYETEDAFRGDVAAALAELEVIGHRLGGAFLVAPIRVQHNGQYIVTGWRLRHTGMPAAREQQPETVPEIVEAAQAETEDAMAAAEAEPEPVAS